MPTVEIFLTGDQIGTYSGLSSSGNSNGSRVTLNGVQALGGEGDIFRVVIRQVNAGDDMFRNGQMMDIYAWPDTSPPGPPLYSSLNPQHDQFQGRASSGTHQVITSPARIVIATDGITPGTMQFGPGANPPRDEQLRFESFAADPPVFPCFAAGTVIETGDGPRAVETLRPGDLIVTADHGLQPLRWIGQRAVPGTGHLAPVRFAARTLGNRRDLLVSPQHRMLLQDWRAEMYFGRAQVLVAAKHLVNGTTIRHAPQARITYVHLAFDRHEVIFAEGCPCESLHLAPESLAALGDEMRDELARIFPDLFQQAPQGKTARPCLRGWEGALVV